MNARRDRNFVTTAMAWNGTELVPLRVNPVTGRLLIDNTADLESTTPGIVNAIRDRNFVPSIVGTTKDGSTAAIQVNSNNSIICSMH